MMLKHITKMDDMVDPTCVGGRPNQDLGHLPCDCPRVRPLLQALRCSNERPYHLPNPMNCYVKKEWVLTLLRNRE